MDVLCIQKVNSAMKSLMCLEAFGQIQTTYKVHNIHHYLRYSRKSEYFGQEVHFETLNRNLKQESCVNAISRGNTELAY